MDYLTVGRSEILEESFREVQDSNLHGSIKPKGGMWFTKYDQGIPNYNEWVDYIVRHPSILFYKNHEVNPFCQPCAMVSLKEDANIYNLACRESYDYLVQNFYEREKRFSFQKLSQHYDGIYINIFALYRNLDLELINLFTGFGVNSLILFRKQAIQYYQSGRVLIEPFDYECGIQSSDIFYQIVIEEEKKQVGKRKILQNI